MAVLNRCHRCGKRLSWKHKLKLCEGCRRETSKNFLLAHPDLPIRKECSNKGVLRKALDHRENVSKD